MKWGKKLVALVVTIILGLSLIVIPLASRLSPVQAATTWTKYGVDPVFIDGVVSGGACVIYDSDVGIYKMWYTQATANLDKFDGLIDEILALDLGTLIDDIRKLDFRAIADNDAANLKNIIDYLVGLTGDELKALLEGTSSIISYATSPNGVVWTKQADSVLPLGTVDQWDKYYVGAPCVIKTGPTSYEMWYTGGKMDLVALKTLLDDLSLLSADNIKTLLGDLAILDIQAFIDDVIAELGVAYLIDCILHLIDAIDGAGVAIGHATSTNGVAWTKDANPVLSKGSADAWDRYGVGAPCVIKTGANAYELWYTSCEVDYGALLGLLDAENVGEIEAALLAGVNVAIGRATSTNGVVWTKDTNPVLPKGAGDAWDNYGVATPWVIRHSPTSYEMWYTGGKTVPGTLLDFLRGITDLETTLIDGTNSAIGHATSTNGVAWTKDANPVLSKGSGDAWDRYGVGVPCVIKIGTTYKMWYTGAKSYLSTFILDILGGSDLATALSNSDTNIAIGYASYTPPVVPPVYYEPAPIVVVKPGITDVSDYITAEGVFTKTVIAKSFDGLAQLIIDKGTIGLIKGKPLSQISMTKMEVPPAPPEYCTVIGLVYDFGPDGATFKPPITLTITYDPALIPEGVAEENLVIAMWDAEAGEWVNLVSTVDPVTNTITAKVSHFTAFTVLAYTRPAVFVVSDLSITPAVVDIGEEVTISVLVTNTGDLTGSYEVALKIDNVVVATKEVTLIGGASQEVTFTTSRDVAGTYEVTIVGLSGTFVVGAPAAFVASDLSITPAAVDIGEEVTISVLITNTGDFTGSYKVTLKIDTIVVATKEITLAAGASRTVTFTTAKDVAGTYAVAVDGLSGTFVVRVPPPPPPPPPPINWWLIGGIIAGVIIIGVVIWQVVTRRRA